VHVHRVIHGSQRQEDPIVGRIGYKDEPITGSPEVHHHTVGDLRITILIDTDDAVVVGAVPGGSIDEMVIDGGRAHTGGIQAANGLEVATVKRAFDPEMVAGFLALGGPCHIHGLMLLGGAHVQEGNGKDTAVEGGASGELPGEVEGLTGG